MSESFVEVRTKNDLETAVKSKVEKIVVKGELAEKINKAQKVKKLSKPALIALGAAIAATPFTGGMSGAAAVAGFTAAEGMAATSIVAVAFLGLALIISITNGYDRKFTAKADGFGEASMEMTRK